MKETAVEPVGIQGIAVRAARLTGGLLLGGLLGGIVFLAIAHQGLQRGATDLRFARSLGVLRGFEGSDIPRQGLWTALVIAVVLAVVLLLPGQLLIRRWWVRALPLTAVTFAAWALIYAPRGTFQSEIVTTAGEIQRARLDVGALGTEAGSMTPVVYLLAAVGGAFVAARVSDLMSGREFWEPKDNDIRKGLDELAELGLAEQHPAGAASLELSEQRGPDGRQPGQGDA